MRVWEMVLVPLRFDGLTQHVDTNSLAYTPAMQSLSISYWLKVEAAAMGFAFSADWPLYAIWNWVSVGTFYFALQSGPNTNFIISTLPFADGAWHHLCSVRDTSGPVMRLYIDGVQDGADVPDATISGDIALASNFYIGATSCDPTQPPDFLPYYDRLECEIAEIGIWRDLALGLSDAQAIHALPSVARTLQPTKLVHFWPLEGNPGSVASGAGSVFDLCTPASNGTPYGGPVYVPAVQGYRGLLGPRVNDPDE